MISVSAASAIKGERIRLRATIPNAAAYDQIQIEVVTAGVANPLNALGFGTAPTRLPNDDVETEIDTQHLDHGLYEIGLVRLHSTSVETFPSQLDCVPGRDFPRQPFEVRHATDPARTPDELLAVVAEMEAEIRRRFLEPIDLRVEDSTEYEEFTALCFVRDVLVGTAMRFDHFELVPTSGGLAQKDTVGFVNAFLEDHTTSGIVFGYDEEARLRDQRTNPVCVVHFPALNAATPETVASYCAEQVDFLLLALSLSRDAGGALFSTVVVSRTTGNAVKFSIANPYVGNLLTGGLSGESFTSVATYMSAVMADDMNRFLVGLYKEARRERSRDFQYVRYWQILETIAESRNYDRAEALRDFEGAPMTHDGKPRRVSGSVNSVFNLLRENEIGDTASTWKNVNVWFAFRNAVAHHGSVAKCHSLRESGRAWAEIGLQELAATPDHDRFLWSLKEDVKLVLMRRLVQAASHARGGS